MGVNVQREALISSTVTVHAHCTASFGQALSQNLSAWVLLHTTYTLLASQDV